MKKALRVLSRGTRRRTGRSRTERQALEPPPGPPSRMISIVDSGNQEGTPEGSQPCVQGEHGSDLVGIHWDTSRSVEHYLTYEVVFAILSQFDADRTSYRTPWYYTKVILQPLLSRLCLVNQTWNCAATRLLYRDVFLTSPRALGILSLTLLEREDIRPLARSFFFIRPYTQKGDDRFEFENPDDLDRIYSLCPNLHSETIGKQLFGPEGETVESVLRKHPSNLPPQDVATLTRLELRAADDFPDIFNSEYLPILQDLTIKDYKSNGKGLHWPDMPRLKYLCLKQCKFEDDIPFSAFGYECGCIHALEIIYGTYRSGTLWQDISALGGSLELLTLSAREVSKFPMTCDLSCLPSLKLLRLSSRYYLRFYKVEVIPTCLTFVTIDMPLNDITDAWSAYDCVVMLGHGGKGLEQMQTWRAERACKPLIQYYDLHMEMQLQMNL